MLKEINLDLDLSIDNHYEYRPVGVIENTVNDLDLNELAYEIEVETHKLVYTTEAISAIENSIITSIESGKVIVTDVINVIGDAVNNINKETIVDVAYDNLVIGKENSIYVEGIMDRIKKTAKDIWNKVKTVIKKILGFFKKLLNKVIGNASSGGGGGGSTSVLDKDESKSLNKLVELIKEGDKDKLIGHINKYYINYKELLLKFTEHNNIINFGVAIKGDKITINSLEIKNFKAFRDLKLEGVSRATIKHFVHIRESVEYLNKNRNAPLLNPEGSNTYNVTSKSFMNSIINYNKKLDALAKDMVVSDIIGAKGVVVGIDLNKLKIKDYALMVNELSKTVVTCVEIVKSGSSVKEGKDLTEVKIKGSYKNSREDLNKCIKDSVGKTMIKSIKATGNRERDINLVPTDSPYMFSKIRLDTTRYLKAVYDKFYSGSKTPSKPEGVGIIGLLFNHLEVESIDEVKNLLDSIKLKIGLSIDINKNVESHLEEINNILSKANGVGGKLNKIYNNIEVTLKEIIELTNKTSNDLEKLDKDSEEFIVKFVSNITTRVLEPLSNINAIMRTLVSVHEKETEKLPTLFNKYRLLINRLYKLALVKKALEVIDESK